jgi:hypothetical protein
LLLATPPTTVSLRLGAVDLAPKDVAYVRALVRLFAHTEKLNWSFADAPPYNAVVADARAHAANPGFFGKFGGIVLTLCEAPGAPAADTVAYPIRANQFRDWLKLRQGSLLGVPSQGGTSLKAAVDGRRFKLRRWPHAALLQGDPAALRMATLMSRNAMSTAQLAALALLPEEACRAFVGVLHDAGLLVESVAAIAGEGVAPAIAAAAPVRMGLMASLRRHLGI